MERDLLTPCRYVFVTNLAKGEEEVIRYAALLRGTESAWQAVSYGLTSLPLWGEVGAIYINFGLWGLGLWPAWLVLRRLGRELSNTNRDQEEIPSNGDSSTGSQTGDDREVKALSSGLDTKTVSTT